MLNSSLKTLIEILKPATLANLDGVCIVGTKNEIIFVNTAFKGLAGLSPRELMKKKFCDVIKLAACKDTCQIEESLKTGKALRLDESPAVIGKDKIRVSLKCSLIKDSTNKTVGAFISIRNTTAEILVQAKYKRTQELIKQKDRQIIELQEKIRALRLAAFKKTEL